MTEPLAPKAKEPTRPAEETEPKTRRLAKGPRFVPPPQWSEVLRERARQDDSYQGGGIYVKGCSPTIRNCRISQSRAEFGAGIYLLDSSSSIEDCTITNNAAIEYGGGLQTFRGNVTLRRCDISDNVCGIRAH